MRMNAWLKRLGIRFIRFQVPITLVHLKILITRTRQFKFWSVAQPRELRLRIKHPIHRNKWNEHLIQRFHFAWWHKILRIRLNESWFRQANGPIKMRWNEFFLFPLNHFTFLNPGTSWTMDPSVLTQVIWGMGVPRDWQMISVPVVFEKSIWLGGSWMNTGPEVSDWADTENKIQRKAIKQSDCKRKKIKNCVHTLNEPLN